MFTFYILLRNSTPIRSIRHIERPSFPLIVTIRIPMIVFGERASLLQRFMVLPGKFVTRNHGTEVVPPRPNHLK